MSKTLLQKIPQSITKTNMSSSPHVCPPILAKTLDNFVRQFFHDPQKILKSYVKTGMTVLDFGCGPGVFSIPIAKMVGPSGRVIAADLQPGMLEKVRAKIQEIRKNETRESQVSRNGRTRS